MFVLIEKTYVSIFCVCVVNFQIATLKPVNRRTADTILLCNMEIETVAHFEQIVNICLQNWLQSLPTYCNWIAWQQTTALKGWTFCQPLARWDTGPAAADWWLRTHVSHACDAGRRESASYHERAHICAHCAVERRVASATAGLCTSRPPAAARWTHRPARLCAWLWLCPVPCFVQDLLMLNLRLL